MGYPTITRLTVVLWSVTVMGGCAASPHTTARVSPMHDLVFLTRDGCVNTPTMRAHLDAALRSLGVPLDYQTVDVGMLPDSDPRGGYGTPTVLYKNQDLFGMPEPTIPHAPPS